MWSSVGIRDYPVSEACTGRTSHHEITRESRLDFASRLIEQLTLIRSQAFPRILSAGLAGSQILARDVATGAGFCDDRRRRSSEIPLVRFDAN